MLLAILLILTGYLIGAIPFGWLVARVRGVDILKQGSGNIGATNVGRVLGRHYGFLVFLLDFTKGAIPVLLARRVPLELDWPPDTLAVGVGIAAFLGHMFPIYLRFRGGKGVATGAGVVAVLLPLPLVGALLVWLAVVLATRYVSLGSILASVFLLGQRLLFTPDPWGWDHRVVTLFCLAAAILVIVRHKANIRRLGQGNENQLKESPAMQTMARSLHVLALGICFGAQVFFTMTGLLVFQTFETEARLQAADRPLWFPLPDVYKKEPPSKKFPDPLRLEQGSRAGGAVVAPLFVWYYGLQTGCVLFALACAWSWTYQRGEGWRRGLLIMAVFLLGVGWWLDLVVHKLRVERNQATDTVLIASQPSAQQIQTAEEARIAFGTWHGFSLLQNFATLLVVGIALALAGLLPAQQVQQMKDIVASSHLPSTQPEEQNRSLPR